jgi:hypothetical protein
MGQSWTQRWTSSSPSTPHSQQAVYPFSQVARYGQVGSNIFISAPASSCVAADPTPTNQYICAAVGRRAVWAVDLVGQGGYSSTDYSLEDDGTSFAAPIVSGIVHTMMNVAPRKLSFIDIMGILIQTAVPSVSIDLVKQKTTLPAYWQWTKNQAGYNHSRFFGFGVVDAARAVEMAADVTKWPTVSNHGLLTSSLGAIGPPQGCPFDSAPSDEGGIPYCRLCNIAVAGSPDNAVVAHVRACINTSVPLLEVSEWDNGCPAGARCC